MAVSEARKKRVLLLLSAATYRAEAFLGAAEQLDLDVMKGVDVPDDLAKYWNVPLGLDFNDIEKSTQKIVQYARENPVDAILSVDDSATILAARAGNALGLPGNSSESALAARDKGVMREMLSTGGVRVPGFRRVRLFADAARLAREVWYPCVLKPLRLSGSRGVIRADDEAGFVEAFGRIRRMLVADGNVPEESELLIEEFVPGFEVALEGILTEGSLKTLALFDKPDPLDGPFFEETIYVTPSRLSARVQQEIADCTARAASALGLRQGPVHAELRVNDDGPWMIEIAGRSIGGHCSSILQFGTGMCLEELILRHSAGMPIQSFDRDSGAAGVMMIPIPARGMFTGVEGLDKARAVRGIEDVEITAKLHQPIIPLPEGSSYLGFIFARGDDPASVEGALRESHSHLRFRIAPEIPILEVSG